MSERSVLEIPTEVQDAIATEPTAQGAPVREAKQELRLRKLTLDSSVLRYLTRPSMEEPKTKHDSCKGDCKEELPSMVDPSCCCESAGPTCIKPEEE
jgi:hypothetical protein